MISNLEKAIQEIQDLILLLPNSFDIKPTKIVIRPSDLGDYAGALAYAENLRNIPDKKLGAHLAETIINIAIEWFPKQIQQENKT